MFEYKSLNKVVNDKQARVIVDLLLQEGEARFVGGCIRDAIIGRDFSDIDIATDIVPEGVLTLLKNNGISAIATGLAHGTVTAVIDKRNFEITTLRKDVNCDGRRAEVEFTTDWKEDALRRDFTMNAMSLDVNGEIYDYFGGIDDLKNGVVKFVGNADERIKEDYLRILRLFRFYAFYGKAPISKEHLQVCKENISGIESLSGERISIEMKKMFLSKNIISVLTMMNDYNLLYIIFGNVIKSFNFSVLSKIINLKDDYNSMLVFAAIMADSNLDVNAVNLVMNRWKLSNSDKEYVRRIMFPIYPIKSSFDDSELRKSIRRNGKNYFPDVALMQLCKEIVDGADSKIIKQKFEEFLQVESEWKIPQLPLKGVDIINLGIKEGKEIGDTLRRAENYWEGKNYTANKDDIITYLEI